MNIQDLYNLFLTLGRTSSPNYGQANRGSHYNHHQHRKLKGWQKENNRKGNRWAKKR